MGFNGVRKHQKIETAIPLLGRRAGSPGVGRDAKHVPIQPVICRATDGQSAEVIAIAATVRRRLGAVQWSGRSRTLPDNPASGACPGLYHLTKTLDPTRPVVGNDGWESVATDIIGIHDYDDQLARIASRYGADESLPRLFRREQPGGRMLILGNTPSAGAPGSCLLEFGGIAYSPMTAPGGIAGLLRRGPR